jgi:guanylate kinase
MDLEKLIATYRPPKQAVDVIKNAKIALLSGISGAGKDTITRELLRQPEFGKIVSHTTRQPRANEGVMEQDGVDYHFISEDTAHDMLERGDFVEAKFVHGTVYGTSIAEVKQASEHGAAINDIDVQGVGEYKAVSDQVVAIFIIPPNYDEWVRRLKRRYATEEEYLREWPKRRNSAIKELQKALELPYYHCVINDDLNRAVEVTAEIAHRSDIFTRKDDEARLAARDLLGQITL